MKEKNALFNNWNYKSFLWQHFCLAFFFVQSLTEVFWNLSVYYVFVVDEMSNTVVTSVSRFELLIAGVNKTFYCDIKLDHTIFHNQFLVLAGMNIKGCEGALNFISCWEDYFFW